MKKTSLQDHARLFAQDLSELLNSTVTDGISISATTLHREQVLLGREVGRNSLEPKPIPLSRNRNKANVYLMYTHWCVLDDDDTHLATLISTMNLRWENLQLRAAVRSNPTEAAEELRASGWEVTAAA